MKAEDIDTICCTCLRVRPLRASGECFGCHIKGIGFSWVGGGGYTRQGFHDSTITEARNEELAGHDPNREYEPRYTKANTWAPVK